MKVKFKFQLEVGCWPFGPKPTLACKARRTTTSFLDSDIKIVKASLSTSWAGRHKKGPHFCLQDMAIIVVRSIR